MKKGERRLFFLFRPFIKWAFSLTYSLGDVAERIHIINLSIQNIAHKLKWALSKI
jgi:hypothetical protein